MVFAIPVYAGHWSQFIGKYDCPEINNSFRCARSIESNLNFENILRIDDSNLLVSLNDGSKISLIDGKFHYTALEIIDELDFVVIQEHYYESSRYGLLDLTNGLYLHLWGYPGFSPDKKNFIEASSAIGEDGQNVFRIYAFENRKIITVYDAKAGLWGPMNVSWLNNENIEFTYATFDCVRKKSESCLVKRVSRHSGAWEMDH